MIFGLKGTLIDRLHNTTAAGVTDGATNIGNFRVWKRPGIDEVVQWSHQQPDVDIAVWSSATKRNTAGFAAAALDSIQPKFVWSREQARADDQRRNHVVHEDDSWAVTMDLDLVLREFPEYSDPSQILVVDDSSSKWRFWSHRLLVVPTFDVVKAPDHNCSDLLPRIQEFALGRDPSLPVFCN